MCYKLILFDIDGTLFDFEKAEEFAIEQAFSDHSIQYDKDIHLNAYKQINTNIWREFEEKLISIGDLKIERFNRLAKHLNYNLSAESFSKSYLSHLGKGAYLIEGADEVVRDLSSKYKLAVITNGIKNVQLERLSKSPILKYFEDIIISEEVGHAKPAKEIFEHSLEKLSHNDKKTTLIIGDSLSSDISGGYRFGIDTCWFNPNKKKNNTNIKPTYEINSLYDLLEIL